MGKGLKSVFLWSGLGLAALIVLMFIAGTAVGYFAAEGSLDRDRATVWVMSVFAVLLMVGSMVGGVAWMRSIDEAAQEAHKSAWYWGGSSGMALGGVLVCLASLPQARSLHIPSWLVGRADPADPAAYAATGAFGMMLLMLIGYMAAWGWWWLRRR